MDTSQIALQEISATEFAAIFDLCQELNLIEVRCYTECRELLQRIVLCLSE